VKNPSGAEVKSGATPIVQRQPSPHFSSLAESSWSAGGSETQVIENSTTDHRQNLDIQRIDLQSPSQAGTPAAQSLHRSSPVSSRAPIVHSQPPMQPIQRSFEGTNRHLPGGRDTGAGVHLARFQTSAAIDEHRNTIVNRTPTSGGAESPNPAPPPPAPTSRSGAANVDISGLADQVYQMLVRRLASERQRRGV
jgi:hypothetical protein